MVCPSATSLGMVRIINGNTALTGSHFRINGVVDLPSNVPFATSTNPGTGGHHGFTEWRFPRQQGSVNVAGNTGAATATATVTFGNAYPSTYTPAADVWMAASGVGGDRVVPWPSSESSTGFTMNVGTCDAANFASTATGAVRWSVDT